MDLLTLLEGEVLAMAAAVGSADPDAAIPSCPGWTTRELVRHLVAVHDWARLALDGDSPPPYDERDPGEHLGETYFDASQQLLGRLREVPTDHPCWTFDKTNRTASFWLRRQLHEISIHRWDLAPYSLDEDLAGDGIDEVISFFAARRTPVGATERAGLRLTTPDRTWTLGNPPYTTVSGTASELLLRLWGRGVPLPAGWVGLTP